MYVGHDTVGEQSSSHQNQRKKLRRHKLKGPATKTRCVKNLRKNKKRTTGAEDTQNQHCQRVRTFVDSFPKLLLVLRFTGKAGVYTPPRPGLPLHTETSASISR